MIMRSRTFASIVKSNRKANANKYPQEKIIAWAATRIPMRYLNTQLGKANSFADSRMAILFWLEAIIRGANQDVLFKFNLARSDHKFRFRFRQESEVGSNFKMEEYSRKQYGKAAEC